MASINDFESEPSSPNSESKSKILVKFHGLHTLCEELRAENNQLREELLRERSANHNKNSSAAASDSSTFATATSLTELPVSSFDRWVADLALSTESTGNHQALEDLYKKVQQREVRITTNGTALHQEYCVARLYLVSNMLGTELCLFEHDRFDLTIGKQKTVMTPLEVRMREEETWEDAIKRGLQTMVGIQPDWQDEIVVVDETSHLVTRETNYDQDELLPGFTSSVTVHEVHARIKTLKRGLTSSRASDLNFEGPQALERVGLPSGRDFVYCENSEGANMLRVWCWKSREYEQNGRMRIFEKYLASHGIDVSKFGVDGNKSLFEFYREVKEEKASSLVENLEASVGSPDRLLRMCRIVKVQLFSEVNKCRRTLMEHEQYDAEGRKRTPDQCIMKKLLADDNWETAVPIAINARLGITCATQGDLFWIDHDAVLHDEETAPSKGFAGINSNYRVTTVPVYVTEPNNAELECIGLPHGHDFVSKEFTMYEDRPTLHVWTWKEATGDTMTTGKVGGTALLDLNSNLNDVESILAQTIHDDNWSDAVGLGSAFRIALDKIQLCVGMLTNLDATMHRVDIKDLVAHSHRGSDMQTMTGITRFIEANFTADKRSDEGRSTEGRSTPKRYDSSTGLNIAPGELDGFSLEHLFETAPPCARSVMQGRNAWDFDFFALAQQCECAQSLLEVYGEVMVAPFCVHAFECDQAVALQFVHEAAEQHRENPYHGPIHAVQVCHHARWLTKAMKIMEKQSELESTAFMLAALCHDIKHFSRNNNFCVMTEHPLSMLYNNSSVLENFHSSACLQLIESTQLIKNVALKDRRLIRSHIIEYILATDMAEHFETLSKFRVRREGADFSLNVVADRRFLARLCLKAGDLGHACLPWDIHLQWSIRVTQEFYAQGDEERQLGLNVSALCDRSEVGNLPKSQKGFLEFVVQPLCELMAESQSVQPEEEPDGDQQRPSDTRSNSHQRKRFSALSCVSEMNIDRVCTNFLHENSQQWQTDPTVVDKIKAALGLFPEATDLRSSMCSTKAQCASVEDTTRSLV